MSEQQYEQLIALLDAARADIVAGDPSHPDHLNDYESIVRARDVAVRLRIWRGRGNNPYGEGYLKPRPTVTPESLRA